MFERSNGVKTIYERSISVSLFLIELLTGVSRNSRSRPLPGMKASDSRSQNIRMDFFITFPFPNFGNVFFFIPFPFPNFWNLFFSFPSRSRNVGMDFFIPFPFPNLLFHRRESKRELEYCSALPDFQYFQLHYIS